MTTIGLEPVRGRVRSPVRAGGALATAVVALTLLGATAMGLGARGSAGASSPSADVQNAVRGGINALQTALIVVAAGQPASSASDASLEARAAVLDKILSHYFVGPQLA